MSKINLKNLPYWLRWGIRLGLIFFIIHLVVVLKTWICVAVSAGEGSVFCKLFMLLILYPTFLTLNGISAGAASDYINRINSNQWFFVIIIIVGTLLWFIIGAVAGWLYGKIKARKLNNS